MQGIVDKSNCYAQQVMGRERFDKSTQITLPELRAYIRFSILMGINKCPCIEDYWRRDPILFITPQSQQDHERSLIPSPRQQ